MANFSNKSYAWGDSITDKKMLTDAAGNILAQRYDEETDSFVLIGEEQKVEVATSEIIVPVDVQARYTKTIQTHTAQMVPPNAINTGAFYDASGFGKLAVTLSNDAATPSAIVVYWSHDGTNRHGREELIANSEQRKVAVTEIKGKYFAIEAFNGHTAPHTMNTWAYLKA